MAVDFNAKPSYLPTQQRFRLPSDSSEVSIFLLSDSYEYDLEMIKMFPQPKMNYKSLLIPCRFVDSIGGRPVRYILTQNDYNKKIMYAQKQRMTPNLITIRFPYEKTYKENLYIPFSELMNQISPALRQMNPNTIQDQIFNLFGLVASKHNFSKKKVLWIDTRRFRIFRNPSMETFKTDLVNALLTAYAISPMEKIKRASWVIIFHTPDADYKFDLSAFEERDRMRLRQMLNKIGVEFIGSLTGSVGSRQASASLDEIKQDAEEAEEIEHEKDKMQSDLEETIQRNKDDGVRIAQLDENLQQLQDTHKNAIRNLKSTINGLMDELGGEEEQRPNDPTKKNRQQLYDAKAFSINADLQQRINPNQQINQTNAKKLSDDLTQIGDSPVEREMISQAAQKIDATPADTKNVLNSTSNAREEKLRQEMGNLKLNNVTFNKLVQVNDVPKPDFYRPLKTTTTTSAQKGTQFSRVTKEYESKLMDRDIVATLMGLSKPSDGFYVTNVEITDKSNAVSMVNDWKITLKSKVSGLQNIIHIFIPKMFNGRFFMNGTWYSIDKQDFPIPVLKINPKTVILTSNYNKITLARYDTKSLVDLTALKKLLEKQIDIKTGQNQYVRVGSNVNVNMKYVSTIEYDEFAKMWYSLTVPEIDAEFCFNRNDCLKKWQFVSVNQDEFCCGMVRKTPVIVNTETSMTREGKTLTQTIVDLLPEHLQSEFYKMKPGKTSMYATIKIGGTVPMGVALAAWEGISNLLKISGVEYRIVEPRFKDPNYLIYPFKDKSIAIRNTIYGQLVFNGFYRLNTKAYNFADFDVPIMESNSIYVDLFNQHFFSQYSQLTTFITYYNFFMDAITADVCNHYNMPNTLPELLLYGTHLLCDNNFKNEFDASLYRIRCSEIIPAMIHYHLAVEMSKYNNKVGSRSRKSKFQFNPNCIVQELTNLETCNQISALNPFIELHAREVVSTKGFRGVNNVRSYSKSRRSYNDSMIGKIAMATPNSGNCGIQRQLTADPKIESVRGYTSVNGVSDTEFTDLQLSSFSELLTPGTVARDDAIRTAIATSQTGHIVATETSSPTLISNGVDEIVPAYLTDEFAVMADDDGKVLEIADGYMIVQYKNQEKQAIPVNSKLGFNSGSGFYVDNKLVPNFEANESFKKNDILAYHERFFTKDSMGQVRMNVGPLAKVAFYGSYFTYEDSGSMTTKLSKQMSTRVIMKEIIKLDATEDVDKLVQVGDEIEIGDPLITFGLGDTGDKSVDNFLKAFGTTADDDSFKRIKKSDHAGEVVDVKIYTNKSLDKLSPSLFKIVSDHFKQNRAKRKILDKYDGTSSVYKLGTLYDRPTEPLKTPSIKGINTDVLIEIYISHDDEVSVGDKIADYGACKQVISEIIPEGLEPYSEFRPEESIDLFQAPSSVLKRMVPSLVVYAAGNKVLRELKRSCKKIWEG
jgi:hypothetical protein